MKSLQIGETWVIRLEKEDGLIEKLKDFCLRHGIESGYFQAIGAISKLQISAYNQKDKKYVTKKFDEPLEIASLIGNIATLDSKIVIHAHIVCSRFDFTTIAGHLDEAIISATCEIHLMPLESYLTRKYNPEIGLNLLDI